MLTFCPELLSYLLTCFIISLIELDFPLLKISRSSTYARWLIQGPFGLMENGINLSLLIRLLSILVNTSAASMNNEGDNGSPCFNPWLELKKPFHSPLTMMEYHISDIRFQMMLISTSEKPYFFRTTVNFHDILSYALAMSSFITIFPPILLLPIPCTIS